MDRLSAIMPADDLAAVLTLDVDDRVLAASDAWLTMIGLPATKVLGQKFFDLPFAVPLPWVYPALLEEVRNGMPTRLPEWHIAVDGRLVRRRAVCAPIRLPGGTGVVITLTAARSVDEAEGGHARQLAEVEDRFGVIFGHAPIGMALLDLEGKPLQRNPAMERVLERCFNTSPEGTFPRFTHPEDQGVERELFRHLVTGERDSYHMEKRLLLRGGGTLWVRFTAVLVRDRAGSPMYVVTMVEDIDTQRRATEALRASEERFRSIFESGPIGMTSADVDGRLIACNRAFAELLGYDVSELLGRSFSEYTHPDDFASHLLLHLEMVEGKRDRVQVEKRIIAKDGRTVWVRTTGAMIRPGDSKEPFIINIIEDVTERHEADELRKNERKRLRNILQTAQDGFCIFDRAMRIVEVNEAYCWMTGYRRGELLALSFHDIEVLDAPEESLRRLARLEQAGSDKFETRQRRKDGSVIDVEVSARYLKAEGVVFAFLRDVTERNMMETALRESERRYRILFDRTSDALIITDLGGRVIEANSVARERLGYSREELLGMHVSAIDVRTPENGDPVSTMEMSEVGRAVFETSHRTKKGRLIPTEVSARLIEYEGREAIFSICRDMTERKQLQEQLNRAQRLETAGRVAGQVAHDFNNLLGPMAAYPELIKMELPEDHRAAAYCDEMSKAARLMAEINSDMLVLSRRGLLKQEPVNLNHLVAQALQAAGPVPDSLHLDLRLPDRVLPVSGSPGQLLRVISNLISNAREAMQDRGVLTVTTENVSVTRPFGRYERVEPGEYVVLTVRDNGPGIPGEIRDRIFDPFFSTKKADKRRGSGLGLAIVHSVVEDHKGYVDVDSEVGVGSTFHAYLPVYEGAVQPSPRSVLARGRETILVVDDDPLQRMLARTLLERMGYRVETASSGEDAIAFLKRSRADLVLLDMVMEGGIDGAETYRRIAQEVPGQKAIIMSGFAESDRVQDARTLGVGDFVMKPLTIEGLSRAIREELDQRQPA